MADQTGAGPSPPAEDKDKLTQAEKDKITEWYNRNAPNGATCPICSTKNWAVLDHFVIPVAVGGIDRNNIMLGGPAYAHFMLACQTCGNVQFINAFRAEILKATSEESKK